MTATAPLINSQAVAAYVHDLKCWAESFDAIVSGKKRAEVRVETDRKFKAGDMLRLSRTDHEGKITEPRVQLVIEILHVERHAGPLELMAVPLDVAGGAEGGVKPTPIAVLSLAPRFERHHPDVPAAPAAGGGK